MRRTTMLLLAAMSLAGCESLGAVSDGGSGGTGGNQGTGGAVGVTSSCTYTVSGAQSETGTCMADGFYVPDDPAVHFEVLDGSTFIFSTGVPGLPNLSTGTFDNTSVPASYGAVYRIGNVTAYNLCSVKACTDAQGAGPIPPQGSFTLSISAVGPDTSANGETRWLAPQGTLTATMPAEPGGSESGTIVVDVTF